MTHGCTLVNVYITDMKTVEIPKNNRKAPRHLAGEVRSTFMHHDLKHRIQAMRDKLEGRAPVAEIQGSSQLLSPSRNVGKRAARTVLTGMCYSVGSATRQGVVR